MSYKLKVVKVKEFKANEKDHKHYSVAYKGRLFSVNTLRWADDLDQIEHNAKDSTLTIKCDVDVLQRVDVDGITGETKTYLDLMPKCNLALAAF